jgi:hypothetical protein
MWAKNEQNGILFSEEKKDMEKILDFEKPREFTRWLVGRAPGLGWGFFWLTKISTDSSL